MKKTKKKEFVIELEGEDIDDLIKIASKDDGSFHIKNPQGNYFELWLFSYLQDMGKILPIKKRKP